MFKQFAAAAALALVASSSFAAPAGVYDGLDIGSTKIDDFSGRKTSVGILLGYGFNPNIAVELGYRFLGKFDVLGADVSAKQAQVSVIGSFPLNRQFDVYGRLGYNNLRAETKYGNVTYGADVNGGLYGIGVGAKFEEHLFGRFEVQKPSSDSTNISVSIIYKF